MKTFIPSERQAALHRFYEARYGLFIHYGLYSLLARHEQVQFKECIPVAEYAGLIKEFTAENFNAREIARFAVDCGMRYVNLTTRHCESFCLWDTKTTEFNSVRAPRCGRDLVAELAEACNEQGLFLCLYITHGRDWRHPHAPNNDRWGGNARPPYDPPEPSYATGEDHDLQIYIDYVNEQVRELLTGYGPIAAIWLDGVGVPRNPKGPDGRIIQDFDPRRDGDVFQCQKLYDLVHELQPGCLVSYKQGYLGTEDFFAPEHRAYNRFDEPFSPNRPGEVCTTMTPGSWGFHRDLVGTHLEPDQILAKLRESNQAGCNLLLNTGPMPDGSLVPGEAEALREAGRRLAKEGFPPRAGQ